MGGITRQWAMVYLGEKVFITRGHWDHMWGAGECTLGL